MKVAIIGAGAIGGWIGIRLAQAGHRISVLARGETLQRLRNGAWRMTADGRTVEQPVVADDRAERLGVQDLVVIAVKGPALPGVAGELRPMIGPETVIVPAMNGVPWWFLLGGGGDLAATPLDTVDADGTIAESLPFGRVLGSVVHASVVGVEPGHVLHKAGNRLILGEPGGGGSDRLDRIAGMFSAAGFDVVASPTIRADIWYKLWGNLTMNPLSAITGATCDRLLDDPLLNAFILRIMAEAQAIGERIGCPIDERGEDRNAVTRELGAFKTSMLQDAEAGRPLEIDQLVGAPLEIARRLGLAVPNLETLLGLVRVFGRSHGLYPA